MMINSHGKKLTLDFSVQSDKESHIITDLFFEKTSFCAYDALNQCNVIFAVFDNPATHDLEDEDKELIVCNKKENKVKFYSVKKPHEPYLRSNFGTYDRPYDEEIGQGISGFHSFEFDIKDSFTDFDGTPHEGGTTEYVQVLVTDDVIHHRYPLFLSLFYHYVLR